MFGLIRKLIPDSWVNNLWHLPRAFVANWWYGFPSRKLTLIGVTGTDGKTTTVNLIYHILKTAEYKVSMISTVKAVIGNEEYPLGFHVTSPHPFDVQKFLKQAVLAGTTHMVVEVTSHALSQYRFFGCHFAVGVITNVTHEHLDYHKTFRDYLSTKLLLAKNSQNIVLNKDDVSFQTFTPRTDQKLITFGMKKADMTPRKFKLSPSIQGTFNQYNQLAAIGASQLVGVKIRALTKALNTFPGVVGRLDIVYEQDFKVIIDFAHTPNAFEQVLKTVRPMVKRQLIHVFGCAGLRDVSKRQLMGKLSAQFADMIILTEEDYRTENIEDIMDEIERGIAHTKPVVRLINRQDALDFAIRAAKAGDCVITTGKAHEKSLCRGVTEYPWDEFEAVQNALKKRKGETK